MIKPWLFEFFRAAGETSTSFVDYDRKRTPSQSQVIDQFSTYWDMWTKAEGYGFEGIFFSEHHFGPGYSPSPNLLIASLAPVTKTLRLGVMGVVLPYYEPWRVIEEIGMLDQLTQGRLEVGTASGIPPEMARVGIGLADAGERNAEIQDLLDWALTHPGQPITHHGKRWNCDNLLLVPPPRQQPTPNRWTTVVSESSARRSAKRGTKICTGFSSVEGVRTVFGAYREEAAKLGIEATSDSLGLRRIVFVDEDGGKAREKSAEMQAGMRAFFEKLAGHATHGPVIDAPQKSSGAPQVSTDDYIAGTPAEVAEQILAQCDASGAGHFLCILDSHGGLRENETAFHLYGRGVMPRLRHGQGRPASRKMAAEGS